MKTLNNQSKAKKIVLILLLLYFRTNIFAQSLHYTYDKANRLSEVIYPNKTKIKYTYDKDGNRITKSIQKASQVRAGATNSAYCPGTAITIPYTTESQFNSGNTFTAQLSNSSGSFALPVTLGIVSKTSSDVIQGTIPVSTLFGTKYRIRIISSSPIDTSDINGQEIEIYALPSLGSISGNSTVFGGITETYSVPFTSGTFNWTVTNGIIVNGNGTNTVNVIWNTSGASGKLSVTLTNGSGCSKTQSLNVSIGTNSISQDVAENLPQVSVYPNPSEGFFIIEIKNSIVPSTIEIFDITGKLIKSEKISTPKMQINLAGISKGEYLLKVISKEAILTTKIIIQ